MPIHANQIITKAKSKINTNDEFLCCIIQQKEDNTFIFSIFVI